MQEQEQQLLSACKRISSAGKPESLASLTSLASHTHAHRVTRIHARCSSCTAFPREKAVSSRVNVHLNHHLILTPSHVLG